MRQPVRIGSRVSAETNDWLDKRSKETGLAKSVLVYMAIECYIREVEVVSQMGNMGQILQHMEQEK